MEELKAHKVVSALPGTLEANSVYYVRSGSGFDIYVTNDTGTLIAYQLNCNLTKVTGPVSATDGHVVQFDGTSGKLVKGGYTISYLLDAANFTGTLPAARLPAHTGDVTSSAGSAALTLATVNSNVGTYGSATQVAQITVNAKGLTTAAGNVTIAPAWSSITSTPSTLSGYGITDALPLAGGALTGKLTLKASFADNRAQLNIPDVGTTNPATLSPGDIFGRSNALYRVRNDGTALIMYDSGNLQTPSQAEIEAGAASTARIMSALRVRQGANAAIVAQKGTANGIMGLGSDGKALIANLPDAVLGSNRFGGMWDADTDTVTPTGGGATFALPAASSANLGYFYIVTVAGSTAVDGITDWIVGDWVLSLGSSWTKVDNTDAVVSVAGLTGAISASDLRNALEVLPLAGGTMTGKLTLKPDFSDGYAPLNIPNVGSTDPTTVSDGDFWGRSSKLYWRRSGVTVRLLSGADSPTQAEAEAGTNDDVKGWSAVRVRQAADAAIVAGAMRLTGASPMAGKLTLKASDTDSASLNIPTGAAPTTPVDGDIWYDGQFRGRRSVTTVAFWDTSNLTIVSQADAEAGVGLGNRLWSAQRVRQAADAAIAAKRNVANGVASLDASSLLPTSQLPAFSGDITTSTGSSTTTLATVNSNVGTFGSGTAIPVITANAKGLITSVTTATLTPAWSNITSKPTTLSGYGITDAVKTVNGSNPDSSGNVTIQEVVSSAASYSYNSDGTLSGYTETISGNSKVTTLTYSSGQLSTKAVTYLGVTKTTTYTYNADGTIASTATV